MYLRNLNGTSQNKCRCGSWLKHWENFSYTVANFCSNIRCMETAKHGGHVQKVSLSDQNWYIIPLCPECNKMKAEQFEINDSVALVSANRSKTCEK